MTVVSDADRIGRNVKGRTRSPSIRSLSPIRREQSQRSQRVRSRSPGKIKPIPFVLPCPPPQQPRLDGRIATWGEGHAFEYHSTYEGELVNSPWPPLLEEQVDANATMEESLLEKIRAASLGWSG